MEEEGGWEVRKVKGVEGVEGGGGGRGGVKEGVQKSKQQLIRWRPWPQKKKTVTDWERKRALHAGCRGRERGEEGVRGGGG